MPAVDPARLERQIRHVTEVFADPVRLRSRTADLLEFYGNRVRPSASGGRTGSLRSLGVPTAVLRALQQALEEQAAADPHAGAMAAETLWTSSVLEARWLAVSLLERQSVHTLPSWIVDWSETAEDPDLVARLATGPMRRLWHGAPDLFWECAAANLQTAGSSTAVTLLALQHIIPDLEADDLPRVFEILEASPVPVAGEAWRAYLDVVRVCARRSPAETARFLVDAIENARPGATRAARQTLSEFPPRQRDALRHALRLSESRSRTSSA